MGSSTTENSSGGLKRVYAGERRTRNVYGKDVEEEYNDKTGTWFPVDHSSPNAPRSSDVKNLSAKVPSPADLEDKPGDSPLIRASKRRQRMQREAMKQ